VNGKKDRDNHLVGGGDLNNVGGEELESLARKEGDSENSPSTR